MRKFALVVGVSKYGDPEIADLSFAGRDAEKMAEALQHECSFDDVRLLTTGGEREPDHVHVVDELSSAAPLLEAQDLFLFYFAGHGIHTGGEGYLLTANSRIRMPQLASVQLRVLQECLANLDCAQRVLIFDACRNDPFRGRGDGDNLFTDSFRRDILAVADAHSADLTPTTCLLFSCREGERAYEWDDQRHGVFTYYLLEGVQGTARHADGSLSVQRLAQHVEQRVSRWARKTRRAHLQRPWAEQLGSLRDIMLISPGCTESPEVWHYRRSGVQYGPMTEHALREAIEAGTVQRTDLAWHVGMDEWEVVYEIDEYRDVFITFDVQVLQALMDTHREDMRELEALIESDTDAPLQELVDFVQSQGMEQSHG